MMLMYCAHFGIASAEVNNPHIKINMIIKKKLINKACCCVLTNVEISNPKPNATIRKTDTNNSNNSKLPTIGILKNILEVIKPTQNTKCPIIQNGINFPIINSCFFSGVTFNCRANALKYKNHYVINNFS